MKLEGRSAVGFAIAQLRHEPALLAAAMLWRLLFRLLPVQVPLFAGALIDGLQGNAAYIWGIPIHTGDPAEAVRVVGAVLVGLSLATGATAYLSERASRELQTRCTARLRQLVQRAWAYAPASVHRSHGVSAVFERTLSDTRGIGRFARGTVTEGFAALARLAYPVAVLLWIDPWMALLPIAATPLHLVFSWALQRRRSRLQKDARNHRDALSRTVRESLQGIECLQGVGAQARMLARIDFRVARCQRDARIGSLYHSLAMGSVWALPALALAGSWWMGGARVVSGEISTGQMVAFAGFAAYLGVPLRRLAQQGNKTRQGLKSMQRLLQFLRVAQAAEHRGTEELRPFAGELTAQDLCYTVQQRPVLQNLCFSFPAGQFTWLRGGSGSGKSTLLRLLAGLEAPDQGAVLVDGQDLAQCTSDSISSHIALVPQHPSFLSGTIASNLRLGAPHATDEEVLEACARVGLENLIQTLPKQLQTPLGERSMRLSASEAQRLNIARALLRKPRVLLLDEPMAGLDPASERTVLQALLELQGSTTVILATHRMPPLDAIRHIVELEAGILRAAGPQTDSAQASMLAHLER